MRARQTDDVGRLSLDLVDVLSVGVGRRTSGGGVGGGVAGTIAVVAIAYGSVLDALLLLAW